MDKEELKKINIVCEFLNDLAAQMVKKMKETGQEHNKLIISELYEMVGELKKTIEESGEKMPKIEMATSPMMSQIKQYKIEVQPKIEIPPFPKFPEFPKIPELASIIAVLSTIVREIQQKDVKIDLTTIEYRLQDLQDRLSKEIEGLKDAIPRIPELPTEQERIKVILPDRQIAKMGGGASSSIVSIRGSARVGDGTTSVANAGTRVQLSDIPCKRVFIANHQSNASLTHGGVIVVGGSTVVAALVGRRGFAIFPTNGEWFNISNLNLLYIDSVDDGAKCHYFYEN